MELSGNVGDAELWLSMYLLALSNMKQAHSWEMYCGVGCCLEIGIDTVGQMHS